MNNQLKYKLLFYALIGTCVFIIQGCYTTSTGDLLRSDRIAGSEKEVSTIVATKIVNTPTSQNPVLTLSFLKKSRYNVSYQTKYTEVKKPSTLSLVGAIGGLVGFIVSAASNDKKVSSIGMTFFAAGAIGIGIASLGKTNNIIDGEIIVREEEGDFEIISEKIKVKIKHGNIAKDFLLDDNNEVKINLIKDLKLKRTEEETIVINIDIDQINYSDRFGLLSSNFLDQFVLINSSQIEVFTELDGNLIKVGIINKGEEYKLLHKGTQLWKIDYKGKEGFIPPNSGKIFWAVPDYKK